MNSKGTEPPAHLHSMISTLTVRHLDKIQSVGSVNEFYGLNKLLTSPSSVEPRREKTCLRDTNRSVRPKKMARGFKFRN